MNEATKKAITVGELVYQKYANDFSKIRIPAESIAAVQRSLQSISPTLEKVANMNNEIQKIRDIYNVPTFYDAEIISRPEPIESYIVEGQVQIINELKKLNDNFSSQKKEVGILVFNVKEKSLIRDTETRRYVYKFSERGMNFKLVKKLIECDRFRQTRNLKDDIGSKTEDSVRKKVGEINEKISTQLRKNDLNFIIGESGAGYRINPNIKIHVID